MAGCMERMVGDYIRYIAKMEQSPAPAQDFIRLSAANLMADDCPALTLVAVDTEGKGIGFIVFNGSFWVENAAKAIFISAFSVDPRWRQKGVGQLLMDGVEIYARENGYDFINLTVHHVNDDAIRFYARRGAEVYEREMIMTWLVPARPA